MDEQRQQSYLKLIQTLLTYPSGREMPILHANWNLVDPGLIQMMGLVADKMAEEENRNLDNWFRLRRLGEELSQMLGITLQDATLEEYFQFLMEVLRAVSADPAPQSVYPFLQQNLDKLDENLQHLLEIWARQTLQKIDSEQAIGLTTVLFDFSNLVCQFTLGNQANNQEIGIVGYKAVLTVFNAENFPQQYATVQINLGNVYRQKIKGDRAENIEKALSVCKLALQIVTKEDNPQKWAKTHDNIGNAYADRIKGERAENIEEAIAAYKLALRVRTEEKFPVDWAATQNNIGNAYWKRIKGDKAENIEEAIAAYKLALRVHTEEKFPVDWALTQNNIGLAYNDRIKGKKAENIEEAIAAYKLALRVRTEEAFPVNWAATQNNLGNAYGERIRGEKANNIEEAIAAYKLALRFRTEERFPLDWALTQNNLGVAYWKRIKGDKAENIEEAIVAFQKSFKIFTEKNLSYEWANTQNNLAAVYCQRIKGDKAENIERAIAAYEQVLPIYTQSDFPYEWARTQNNIAIAYWERIKGDKAENIERAIAAYRQALQVYTQSAFPYDWANIQNNLGIAYWERIKGDNVDNIESAIAACHQSLQVYTQSTFPYEWARSKNNLGNAYLERIKGDKAENIEQAISAYRQSLQVWTQSAFPYEWARAQNNLGNAYCDRVKGDKAENTEQAISAYRQTLQVYTQSAFPYEWASTQNALGTAYGDRIKGNKAENIEQAIVTFRQALQVCTQSALPQKWAMTQNNLATAYVDRIKGDKAENIEQAIAYYRQALQIYTPKNFPIQCLRTGYSLGNLGFKNGNWQLAIEGYKSAIAAVEQSRNWATNDDRRQEILTEAIDVYDNIVQAYINLGQIDNALEYVERSRSKRLVDLMVSNDLYSGGEISPEVHRKLQAYELLQQQINRERLSYQSDSDRTLQEVGGGYRVRAAIGPNSEKIAQLEAEKQQVWQQLRSLDTVLAGGIEVSPPNLAAMQQLISSPTTAILSFYSTDNDTYIFILHQNHNPQLHTCTGQGLITLQNWIIENWSISYIADKNIWRNQISSFLAELSQRLQLDELISQYLGDIEELILVPHLLLHQIPFAALPITNTGSQSDVEYLGDRFRLRTVPSCQVLEFCHNRPQLEADLNYGIVEDATEDLPLAAFECEQIAQLYNIPGSLRLKGRQSATVENYRQLVKQVQGLHSSHHALSRLDNPLESMLQLGDGFITLGELMTPGWRLPNLSDVFLSCCETNLGRTEITDDLLTLSTGFLCAGARTVVNTLWAVEALATALFSILYYQFRQQGDNRPTALQKAQVALRTLSGEEFAQRYKGEIESFLDLDRKLKEAYAARKQAKKECKKHPPDSEAYQQWNEEYERLDKLEKDLKGMQNRLKDVCKQSFPFESPFFWAAFTCQGLP